MTSLSKIVKAIAVVDDRPLVKKTFADVIEAELNNMPVIKKQLFNYRDNPYTDPELVLPDKKGYIDELNRLKIEIAQAKAELKSLGRDIDKINSDAEEFEAEFEAESEDPAEIARAAQAEAERMLRETRENVQTMMAAYEEEGKKLSEEAKNKGYLEGFEQGFAQAQGEFKNQNDPKTRELDDLLEQVSNYREEQVAQNERDLLELVMTVSRKIIGREIKEDPRAVVTMLYGVLDQNRREEHIRITVSPELMPVEAKASAEIRKLITQTAPSALVYVDEDAEEGTVIVETDNGITDMSVKTQMENIKEMLQS